MCMQGKRGFTLVEILAVLVIIGIASAIVVPSLGTRDDLKAAAAARVLVSDLIYAQNLAITKQAPCYVRFDVSTNSYRLLSAASPGGDTVMTSPLTQQPYIERFGAGTRFESITLTSATFDGLDSSYAGQFTVAFDEIGAPYAYSYSADNRSDLTAGSIVITSGTFTKTITISPYTGELSVQ